MRKIASGSHPTLRVVVALCVCSRMCGYSGLDHTWNRVRQANKGASLAMGHIFCRPHHLVHMYVDMGQ